METHIQDTLTKNEHLPHKALVWSQASVTPQAGASSDCGVRPQVSGGRLQNWPSEPCDWNFPLLGETPSYHPSAFLKCLTVSGAMRAVG